ncbi:MAG TPA: response regulator transcription factor [Nitrospiraceae bacterium]|jgi:DNA-binding NarL/FixJ family response regulator
MNQQRVSDLRIRTLMVDDHAMFLDELAHLLEETRGTNVVGRAASGEDALEQVARLRPDLVLMDITMPGIGGLEATRRLKAEPDAPRVIVLSLNEDPMYRRAALEMGANGFVPKSKLSTALLPMIHSLFPVAIEDAVGN